MKRNLLFVIVLAAFFLVSASCSMESSGLNDGQTKEIFENFFKKSAPVKWVGSYFGGRLESIEITQLKRGASIKKQNGGTLPPQYRPYYKDCWPVDMHVKGVGVTTGKPSGEQLKHPFEDNANFTLCRSHEDKWQIDPGELMMTGI